MIDHFHREAEPPLQVLFELHRVAQALCIRCPDPGGGGAAEAEDAEMAGGRCGGMVLVIVDRYPLLMAGAVLLPL